MKNILIISILALTLNTIAQNSSIGIPDSVKNISHNGSTGQYSITNPLVYNGSQFTNLPTTMYCISNCISDYLYFYDLDLNIPTNATITGIEITHGRGGCNSGSYVIDTLHLAYNGAIIGLHKRDSTSVGTDILGSSSDNWSAILTPTIVNDNSFGLFINSSGHGICTFAQFNIQIKVYYTTCTSSELTGIPDSVKNVSHAGSTGQYSITNPLVYNGSQFTNLPTTMYCVSNCISDYLYFYDLDLNIPTNATITGIEITHGRGGCNSGSYVIDTLHLAYNGAIIGLPKRDSTSVGTDILGSSSDNWSAILTPTIVNDNSFGLFINSSGHGICTFAQFNIQIKVYYCSTTTNILSHNETSSKITIYPNPITDFINLEVNSKNIGSTYSIYDYTGKIIATNIISELSTQIPAQSIKPGLYVIKISNSSESIKLIKR